MNLVSPFSWKRLVRTWLPQPLTALIDRWRDGSGYSGNYATWAEATRDAGGYQAPLILDRVATGARLVREGRAAYERDSVTFLEPAYQWPLLACLLHARAKCGERLDIVDFGGSLGSLYFQHRAWLAGAPVGWRVVEQAPFVAIGQSEFASGDLSFHATLDEACSDGRPAGIVLSSVLPYLEEPHALLAEIRRRKFAFIIVDRTGFVLSGRDRLTVQQVPPRIYSASYPCWFFNRSGLIETLGTDYVLRAEWPNEDRANIAAMFGGLYFERRA